MIAARTVFFISDGTGITAETLAHSLLSQFEDQHFRQVRMPFVDTVDKARDCVAQILEAAARDGRRPIVVSTLVSPLVADTLRQADALILDFFSIFIAPLEAELGARSTHAVGRSHGRANTRIYAERMEAINFTLAHDDGVTDHDLELSDVILVGVSRCGKTPTSLYLAVQFGLKVANYPLIPDDFERNKLPGTLEKHRQKLFGLTIGPERLAQIRRERRPDSHYASLDNCRYEVEAAQKLMRREGIRWLDSTSKSIEEIAATLRQTIKLGHDTF
ncbi:MAG TPA: pyruvate, water dikinase regulatory protein [Rhodocyclaceae bacterium]|nr:pyruvate, water dikinase regulatory protein [Rhodocyclaceae bacterium]